MAEFFKQFFEFFWAVVNNWAGYATGGFIVATVALWHTLRDIPISRKLGISLAIFFLFMAFFKAWRDQYSARVQTEQRLENNMPRLIGSVDQIIGGPGSARSSAESNLDDTFGLFISMTIKNSGAPSIAEGFRLIIKHNGATSEFIPHFIPDGFTLSGPKGVIAKLNRADMIYEKTTVPIERGALARGWICYQVPMSEVPIIKDVADNNNGSLEIKFQDINEKLYLAKFVKMAPEGFQSYMPGTQPFFTKGNELK